MNRAYKNPDLEKVLEIAKDRPDEVPWVSSKGIPVTLKSIPPYLVQLATASIKKPSPPTYEVKLVGGGIEVHAHDEESILQSSDDDKKEWELYRMGIRQASERATEIILDIILLEGVSVDPKVEESLLNRMTMYGLSLPMDADERMLMARKAYLIGCKEDANAITSIVLALTGVSVTDLSVARASFPDKVEPES